MHTFVLLLYLGTPYSSRPYSYAYHNTFLNSCIRTATRLFSWPNHTFKLQLFIPYQRLRRLKYMHANHRIKCITVYFLTKTVVLHDFYDWLLNYCWLWCSLWLLDSVAVVNLSLLWKLGGWRTFLWLLIDQEDCSGKGPVYMSVAFDVDIELHLSCQPVSLPFRLCRFSMEGRWKVCWSWNRMILFHIFLALTFVQSKKELRQITHHKHASVKEPKCCSAKLTKIDHKHV